MIELRSVSKSYGPVRVVHDFSVCLGGGERWVFSGPSGAGKTTLLRIIAGLEPFDEGAVLIGGKPDREVPPHARGIAMSFQSSALWPHMTLLQNAMFADPRGDDERTLRLFRGLGILHFKSRYPHQVSGGQAQRAALVRALAAGKRLLLLDEPFAHLSRDLQVSAMELIDHCAAEDGAAVVVVSHDASVAERLGARVIELPLLESEG